MTLAWHGVRQNSTSGMTSSFGVCGSRGWLEKIAGGWELSWILNSHSGFPWTPQYGNTGCNLIYQGSGYCALRPGKYSGAAGTDYSNDALMSGSPAGFNANF